MDILITPIAPDDTEAVLKLYRDAIYTISFPEYDAATLTELANRTPTEFNALSLTRSRFVAKLGNNIVGYAGLDTNKAALTECYVSPKYMKKHIGSMLITKVEEEAVKAGLKNLTVLSSLNAVEFYKRLGFKEKNVDFLTMANGKQMRCIVLQKVLSCS